MRADMTPEEVRAAGIYLNGGRRRGWKRRLSALLDTSEATISAWATRSPGNARPISGAATVAIKLLVAMMREELMVTAYPSRAGEALALRVATLLRRPDPLVRGERPITIEGPAPSLPAVQPAPLQPAQPQPVPPQPVPPQPVPPQPVPPQPVPPQPARWLGIQNPRAPDSPLPFGLKHGRGGSRSGQPGSSA